MKNIQELMIEDKNPITALSWDYMINEDIRNKNTIIYDEDIFKNSKIFKISVENEDEEDFEEKEKRIKEEESQKEYDDTIQRIEKLSSQTKSFTNQIKRDMELDAKKREELERIQRLRIEKERKEERERIEREERERKIKEEERLKRERERIQKEMLAKRKDINAIGGTIKEKLIKAANNYENIKKEINKINENQSLKDLTNKLFIKIMEIIPNTSLVKDIEKSVAILKDILKELKDANKKELYIYTCYYILSKIKNLLTSSALNYMDTYIKASLIFLINSKTLTYMFFQSISNSCPYIIPVKNFESIFQDKNIINEKNKSLNYDIKENIRKMTINQYLYFIFLNFDINKNKDIIEDYLTNMESFQLNDINYLISNSFSCFLNVFGNYIHNNNNNWSHRIRNIIKKVKEGLKNERKTTRYPEIINIIDKIDNDLDEYCRLINGNQHTEFLRQINGIH